MLLAGSGTTPFPVGVGVVHGAVWLALDGVPRGWHRRSSWPGS